MRSSPAPGRSRHLPYIQECQPKVILYASNLLIFVEECTVSGQWLRDPEGRFEYRWYDGQNWTDQVSHQGQVHTAPLGGAPAQAPPAQQFEPQGAPQAAQHHEAQGQAPQA